MARLVEANRPRSLPVSRQRMRVYHWLMIVFSVATALAVSLPTIFANPQLYSASAEIAIDPARYTFLYNDQGQIAPSYKASVEPAVTSMLAAEFPRYGTRYKRVVAAQAGPGQLRLTAQAPTASEARELAYGAAFRTTQQIRATRGRELMHALFNYELYLMTVGQPPVDQVGLQHRLLMQRNVFDLTPDAFAGRPALSPIDLADITRAMEVRDEQLTQLLATPDLPAFVRDDLRVDQEVLRPILLEYQRAYRGDDFAESPAFIRTLAEVASPIPQHREVKLALALLVGLIGGIGMVALDRAVGIVAKFRELWSFRELIGNLVARDLKARYKGSVLGYLWSLLNPLLMITIFYLVFRILLSSNITHFHLFLMVALLPWNYFAGAVMESMVSVVGNAALVKKVYFPREILPIAAVLSNLINFVLALPVLFIVIVVTGVPLSWAVLFLPVIIVIETIFLLGLGLALATSTVFFRDTMHITGVILQLWFFLTPVFYALEDVAGGAAKYVRWLNPMASMIDFYRDVLYGGIARNGSLPTPGLPALDGVARTALTALIVLAFGVYVFHRSSSKFGEEL